MVIDLDALEPNDRTAILDMLEPFQRTRVEALLRDYAGAAPLPSDASQASIDMSALSPWLADRLLADGPMTAKARMALRECAASSAARDSVHDIQVRPSLFGRLWSALPGGRNP